MDVVSISKYVISEGEGGGWTDWLNMLETISISASAAAIFSAELGCGRPPPKRNDMSEEERNKR